MAHFRNILVAADFSEGSKHAFTTACSLAREEAAHLTVLKVRASESSATTPDSEVLERLRDQYVPDRPLMTDYRVRSGDVAETILHESTELWCDLIAIGTHGRTGLGRLLTGSVAETVLRRAPCPVLAMRSPVTPDATPAPDDRGPRPLGATGRAGGAVRTIVHATDFSESSEFALRVARELARDQGAQLVLLHVIPMILVLHVKEPVPAEDPEICIEKLEALRKRLEGADLKYPIKTILKVGQSAEVILQTIEETRRDLLVMGTHGRTGLGRLLMGSVAEMVLRHARCPVLLVKAAPDLPAARPTPLSGTTAS